MVRAAIVSQRLLADVRLTELTADSVRRGVATVEASKVKGNAQ
jgi:hypothetical protein